MPNDVAVFAENVVLRIEVAKQQITYIKDKPILIIRTPPKNVANCKKVIGKPIVFTNMDQIDTEREVDLCIPANSIVNWEQSEEELSAIMMNCSLEMSNEQ